MNTCIFYFTGTGKIKNAAQKLQQELPNVELIPIISTLKTESYQNHAKCIGLVFPCHGLTIPIPVKQFLERSAFPNSCYIFAVTTRGGTVFRGFRLIRKLLRSKGKELHSGFIVNMALNDPKLSYFSVPKNEQLLEIHQKALEKIHSILPFIRNNKRYNEDENTGISFTNNKLLNTLLEKFIAFTTLSLSPRVKKYFYANDLCTTCGICKNVCPSGKISQKKEEKPHWQHNIECFLCYACLNFCPSEAVQIYSKIWMKSYTKEKGRYPHPYATVQDLIRQKSGKM